jgi:hypothetical protein
LLHGVHLWGALHDNLLLLLLLLTTEKHRYRCQKQPRRQIIADCFERPEIFTPPELPKPHIFQTDAPQRGFSSRLRSVCAPAFL